MPMRRWASNVCLLVILSHASSGCANDRSVQMPLESTRKTNRSNIALLKGVLACAVILAAGAALVDLLLRLSVQDARLDVLEHCSAGRPIAACRALMGPGQEQPGKHGARIVSWKSGFGFSGRGTNPLSTDVTVIVKDGLITTVLYTDRQEDREMLLEVLK